MMSQKLIQQNSSTLTTIAILEENETKGSKIDKSNPAGPSIRSTR